MLLPQLLLLPTLLLPLLPVVSVLPLLGHWGHGAVCSCSWVHMRSTAVCLPLLHNVFRLLATVPEEDMQRAQRVIDEISRLDEEAAEEAAATQQQGSAVEAARLQSLLGGGGGALGAPVAESIVLWVHGVPDPAVVLLL